MNSPTFYIFDLFACVFSVRIHLISKEWFCRRSLGEGGTQERSRYLQKRLYLLSNAAIKQKWLIEDRKLFEDNHHLQGFNCGLITVIIWQREENFTQTLRASTYQLTIAKDTKVKKTRKALNIIFLTEENSKKNSNFSKKTQRKTSKLLLNHAFFLLGYMNARLRKCLTCKIFIRNSLRRNLQRNLWTTSF